jgi:hypothetical protein
MLVTLAVALLDPHPQCQSKLGVFVCVQVCAGASMHAMSKAKGTHRYIHTQHKHAPWRAKHTPKALRFNQSARQCWIQRQRGHDATQRCYDTICVNGVQHIQLTQGLHQGCLERVQAVIVMPGVGAVSHCVQVGAAAAACLIACALVCYMRHRQSMMTLQSSKLPGLDVTQLK